MNTFYAYLIPDLTADVGTISDDNFDLLSEAQKASKADLLQALDAHCTAEISDPLDAPTFSLCAPESEGDELDLWILRMLTGTDKCVGVFPHAMTTLEGQQVWTYEF